MEIVVSFLLIDKLLQVSETTMNDAYTTIIDVVISLRNNQHGMHSCTMI